MYYKNTVNIVYISSCAWILFCLCHCLWFCLELLYSSRSRICSIYCISIATRQCVDFIPFSLCSIAIFPSVHFSLVFFFFFCFLCFSHFTLDFTLCLDFFSFYFYFSNLYPTSSKKKEKKEIVHMQISFLLINFHSLNSF